MPRARAALFLAVIAAAAASAAAPAPAQEVMICEDDAASGFRFEGGKYVKRDFETQRFTVRIESKTRRVVRMPNREIEYDCREIDYSKTACTSAEVPAHSPIIFDNDEFERVHNFSPEGAFELYVAYGSCSRL